MGFIKKLAKGGALGLIPQQMAGGKPAEGTMMGTLASAIGMENKQHAVHDKVKEIHHYHDKKKK